ncbi:MAG: oxidoreductase [Magnetococcales bacterium]|nr:oxidoreductase [Magnetococcales bacterium]
MALLPTSHSPTVEAIFNAYEADAMDGFRPHLGASIIGKECERALWLDFRWATKQQHPGRLLRLFETGQREEDRIVANLRRIGITVLEVDPDTGRQWRVQAHGGHFGGSLDGVALGVPEASKTWHVCEFKTHNAKSFKALHDKGVLESKPQHFSQMQIYMHLMGLKRALYLAVCKDNDDLYSERVHIDHGEAERLLAKAGRIIFTDHPPVRINDDPSWWVCRFCSHHPVCHEGRFAEINCRTCLHVTSLADGHWSCAKFETVLEPKVQKAGCQHHLFNPDLVPGKQIDTDARGAWVEYQLSGGDLWRNGLEGGAPC